MCAIVCVCVCVKWCVGGCSRGGLGVSRIWGPPLTETHRYSSSSCVAFCFREGEEGAVGGWMAGWMAGCFAGTLCLLIFPKNTPTPPLFASLIHPPPSPSSQCRATVLSACRRAACCLPSVLLCRVPDKRALLNMQTIPDHLHAHTHTCTHLRPLSSFSLSLSLNNSSMVRPDPGVFPFSRRINKSLTLQ